LATTNFTVLPSRELCRNYGDIYISNEFQERKQISMVTEAQTREEWAKLEGFEEVVYEKPAVILGKLKPMESQINNELGELEKMLGGVLK
jgi:hypothetical protein